MNYREKFIKEAIEHIEKHRANLNAWEATFVEDMKLLNIKGYILTHAQYAHLQELKNICHLPK